MFGKFICGLVGFVFCGMAGTASATLIDFESAATGGCNVSSGGGIDGFTLSPLDPGRTGGGYNNATDCSFIAPTANSGDQYMLNFNTLIGEFTKDVGTFTLDSLFVHADAGVGPTTVRFEGLDGVDGNVLYTMDVSIDAAWEQVVFTDWFDVKTFTWDSLDPDFSNIAIDDFSFSATAFQIPEPATFALFSFGLIGLGFAVRRRGSKSA